MAVRRPLALAGAAFLLVAAAALFASPILYLLLPLVAFWVLFGPRLFSAAARPVALGCLLAVFSCGLFAFRWDIAAQETGKPITLTGTVLVEGGRQLLFPEDSRYAVAALLPWQMELDTGRRVTVSGVVAPPVRDGESYLISGGVLSQVAVSQDGLQSLPPAKKPPFWVRLAQERQRLCQDLLTLSPTVSTGVTVGIAFSYKAGIPVLLRNAFSASGMSHLLAVSGLHLSILVWVLVALLQRLEAPRWTQLLCGGLAAMVVCLGAGLSPSVLRAAVMTLLMLVAHTLGRRSDGLTSLAVAAMVMVFACPTALLDLSFQLSFLATLGILVLAPRLASALHRVLDSCLSPRLRPPQWIIATLAVSLAAQLATAPVVALAFGSLPVWGVLVNLVAIPLCYPALFFGLLAAGALLAGAVEAASVLLLPANLASWLLSAIALGMSRLPFAALPVFFPSEYLALGLVMLLVMGPLLLPHNRRRRFLAVCACVAALSLGYCGYARFTGTAVAVSAQTGSVVLSTRRGAVLLDYSQNDYQRGQDQRMLVRLGHQSPDAVLFLHPYHSESQQQQTLRFYGLLDASAGIPPGFSLATRLPYLTEIDFNATKLVKYDATYDRIEKYEDIGTLLGAALGAPLLPPPGTLLCDGAGNLLCLGRGGVWRRGDGISLYRALQKPK